LIVQITGNATAQTPPATGLQIGNSLPDIIMNDVDGNPRSLNQLRGNIVFVDFWASWCKPCRHENPARQFDTKISMAKILQSKPSKK